MQRAKEWQAPWLHFPWSLQQLAAHCSPHLGCRAIGDYELHKQLYKGKASVLYSATCKQSGIHVALKLYRKPRLSDLNWYQAGPMLSPGCAAVPHSSTVDQRRLPCCR